MNTLSFKIFVLLACVFMTAMAQFDEKCVAALSDFENTSEGKIFTKCAELGKKSDLSLCSRSECKNLSLPDFKECDSEEGEVLVKGLKIAFKQYNKLVSEVCKNGSITNEKAESIVAETVKEAADEESKKAENKKADNKQADNKQADNKQADNKQDAQTTSPATGNSVVPGNSTAPATGATPAPQSSDAYKLTFSVLACLVVVFNLLL